MSLVVPTTTAHEVDLVVPATLQGNTAEERIRRRLTFTDPVVIRMTRDQLSALAVDPVLLAASSPLDDYFLLSFGCTFRAAPVGDSTVFEEALIGIRLSTPGEGPQPVALALSPDTASSARGSSLRFSLSVPLGVAEPSFEYTTDGTEQDKQYITAYGRGSSDPEWKLYRRRGHPLSGDVRLAVVVRAAVGVPVQAEIVVAAELRRMWVLRSRADLPPFLHSFDLPASARPPVFQGPVSELPS